MRIARRQGAATLWFTDRARHFTDRARHFTDRFDRGGRRDPWETMPGYWDDTVSRVGTGVSE
ncbi:hypothetical protein GCM10020295_27490 [Streptomyces cinereospinus]